MRFLTFFSRDLTAILVSFVKAALPAGRQSLTSWQPHRISQARTCFVESFSEAQTSILIARKMTALHLNTRRLLYAWTNWPS